MAAILAGAVSAGAAMDRTHPVIDSNLTFRSAG